MLACCDSSGLYRFTPGGGSPPSSIGLNFSNICMASSRCLRSRSPSRYSILPDGRLAKSPAEYIKLPTETGTNGGQVGVVVDRAQFFTPGQVSAFVDATPWPYNVLVHVAAWAGLRAAELAG